MKKHWLAALPLVLAACGGAGGAGAGPDGTMPVPPGSNAELGEAEFVNAITTTESTDAAIEGSWREGSVSRNDALIFSDMDETDRVAVYCSENGGETDMNSVGLRWYTEEGATGESVDIFTSAGAKSFGASESPITVTVAATDPFAVMLAAARGDIRLISGASEIVIPAGEGLNGLIRDCRPAPASPDEDN